MTAELFKRYSFLSFPLKWGLWVQVISMNIVIFEKGLRASSRVNAWITGLSIHRWKSVLISVGWCVPHIGWHDHSNWSVWFTKAHILVNHMLNCWLRKGKPRDYGASLASEGHSRTTLIRCKFSVIYSNLFLPRWWVSWSRGGVDYRRGEVLEENR